MLAVLTAVLTGVTTLAVAAPASAADGRTPNPERATSDIAASQFAVKTGVPLADAQRRLTAERVSAQLANQLTDRLGARSAGAYLDGAGRPVVTVTDEAAAADVRAAGATAQLVTRTAAQLDAVSDALGRVPAVAGASWGDDPRTNQVVLSIPRGASAAALEAEAARHGAAVRVERTDGSAAITSDIAGGDPIRKEGQLGYRCSAGFNVKFNNVPFVLTAGHCLAGASRWINWHGGFLGTNHVYSFPTYDDGLIKITAPVMQIRGVYTWNGQFQSINTAADAIVGQWVCKSGSTTFLTCGAVLRNDVTVNYPQGTVIDLDEVNACTEGGDSGGSVFSGDVALGLVSGGLMSGGRCLGGASSRMYMQPVLSSLNAYQVQLA